MTAARHRLEAWIRGSFPDAVGDRVRRAVRADLGLDPGPVRTRRALSLLGSFSAAEAARVATELFADPVVEDSSADTPAYGPGLVAVEVSYKPGVTDNVARSAAEGIELLLGRRLAEADHVFSSRVFLFEERAVSRERALEIGRRMLCNELIERLEVLAAADLAAGKAFRFPAPPPAMRAPAMAHVTLTGLSDDDLLRLSRERGLVLTLAEMRAVRDHHARPEVRAARAALGLGPEPTDVEMECYAQTWSEHCKHKIFSAIVDYDDGAGRTETVDSLFKSCIVAATKGMLARRPDVLSVFTDNAGVFRFDEHWDLCLKVETHNSPSALEPYGGAMTGIVGVNRDVLGTGRGFKPIFNTDIFCFGPPDHKDPLPDGLLHPRRMLRGVHAGVRDGGNESGIPTVNGSISFDPRFLGKPLVYCGTGGIAPRSVAGRPSFEKWLAPGDAVVMLGGRIGKDGIHGATFSSEEYNEASPTSAVQIGDPITQKRLTDFLLLARDQGLYTGITDNGAGGLSSSIGEMARECGGARIDLARAPLKYPGLAPWEIFLSEAQERMSLAVPQERLAAFLALAERMSVSATVLGEFTAGGFLDVLYEGRLVAHLDMDFLHDGLPRLRLPARWTPTQGRELADAELPAFDAALAKAILSRWNVCSKEDWVRQYDHEVQGMSVVKPFSGVERDAPSDAAVLRPDVRSWRGLAVAHGLLPRYADIDAGGMARNVVDESLRSLVAVGADPDRAVGLDNFCWPDPVESPTNPEGPRKMAQLVRCCRALRDITEAYTLPCISGKDSMKNDYVRGGTRISVPPTLLFTAAAPVPDVRRAVTMDFKAAGDRILLLGRTADELGGSELYDHLGLRGLRLPQVDAAANLARYRILFRLIGEGLVASAHDLSEGGLLVALAESCFGGRLGASVDLAGLGGLHPVRALFSESAGRLLLSVRPEHEAALRQAFPAGDLVALGTVAAGYRLGFRGGPDLDLADLFQAWRRPLSEAP